MDCIKKYKDIELTCNITKMGDDYTLSVYGGTKPHIGSVAISMPRVSLTKDAYSATTSSINCLGHKDDEIAKLFASKVATQLQCVVVCSCGIHIDNITNEQLQDIKDCSAELLEEVINRITNNH